MKCEHAVIYEMPLGSLLNLMWNMSKCKIFKRLIILVLQTSSVEIVREKRKKCAVVYGSVEPCTSQGSLSSIVTDI